jgi:hypothetical protein
MVETPFCERGAGRGGSGAGAAAACGAGWGAGALCGWGEEGWGVLELDLLNIVAGLYEAEGVLRAAVDPHFVVQVRAG